MILAIDVGNSNIVFGGLDSEKLYFSTRLSTDRYKTSDEYAVIFKSLLEIEGVSLERIEGGIISSVVPSLKKTLQDAMLRITGKKFLIVGPGLKNGLRIRIDDPAQLGSDRVADAVAAIAEYPRPILIFDMGTATTFSVINSDGDYLGGMIMPGALIGLDALAGKTSQLPQISLEIKPANIIGTNTVDCMRNGTIYGNAAMLDGIIDRMTEELGELPTVIATGGVSELIVPYCRKKVILDKDLLLKGLRIIYEKNRKAQRKEETVGKE